MARKADTKNLKDRNGTWWLWARRGGQMLRRSLRTSDLATAQRERDRILAPLNLKDEADRARALADAAKSAEDRAAKAIEDAARREGLAVADAWQAFVDSEERPASEDSTMKDYSARWAKFADWWADYAPDRPQLREVTREDAAAFARYLKAGCNLSANRRNKIVTFCRCLFRTVKEKACIEANPWGDTARDGIRNLPQRTVKHRPLSEGELRNILATANDDMRLLLAVGALTGQRIGDCATLDWSAVNLARNVIIITPQKTKRTGKTVTIPLHPQLRALLELTPPEERVGAVNPWAAREYGENGSRLGRHVRRLFQKCGIQTQVDAGTAKPRAVVSFHSLRHGYVSMCRERGVPEAVVMGIVGHSSGALTDHYTTVGDDALQAAARALPNVLDTPTGGECGPLNAGEALAAIRAALIATSDHGPLFEVIEKIINATEVRP